MKKKYVVYLKNGKEFEMGKEKYEGLTAALDLGACPQFVNFDGNIINISAIMCCAIEDDHRW